MTVLKREKGEIGGREKPQCIRCVYLCIHLGTERRALTRLKEGPLYFFIINNRSRNTNNGIEAWGLGRVSERRKI